MDNLSPRLKGFLRGLAEAVVSAIIVGVISYLEVADIPASFAIYVPIFVTVLRTLEAELLDQNKPRPPRENQGDPEREVRR